MSYNSTTKIITAAVSIDDLKRCFQVVLAKKTDASQRGYSCDLGMIIKGEVGDEVTDAVSGVVWKVHSRSDINMWARYKPETPVTGLTTMGVVPITLAQRQLNGYSIEALQNTVYGSISGLVSDLRAGTVRTPFVYRKPTGGAQSAFRMTDLENYWHLAPCPITSPYTPGNDTVSVSPDGNCTLYYYVDVPGTTRGLGLSDLRIQMDSNRLSDYYFGILFWNNDRYFAMTQQVKMGDTAAEGLSVDFTLVNQIVTQYYVIPFFSIHPFLGTNNPGTVCSMYPMVFAESSFYTVLEQNYVTVSMDVYVWKGDSTRKLYLEITVVNHTSGTFNWSTQDSGNYAYTNPDSPIGKSFNISRSHAVSANSTWNNTEVLGTLDASDWGFIDVENNGANNLSVVHAKYNIYNGVKFYNGVINVRIPE